MIAIAIGTRAELIKTFTLMKELERRRIPWIFIHTGQHNIEDLLNEFKLKMPDFKLDFTEEKSGRFKGNIFRSVMNASWWSLRLTTKLRSILLNLKPKIVLCQGDTMTTAVVPIASRSIVSKRPIIGHVEAGLRTYNIFEPFPEEISRRIADKFSDLLFAPTKTAVENLNREIKLGKVFLTGNTIVDAVNYILKKRIKVKNKLKKYVIAQIHRQENINSYERTKNFVELVTALPYDVLLIMHSNTLYKLEEFGLWNELKSRENIIISGLMKYSEFIFYLKNSIGIITDSGGVTEECTVLRKPCLIFREKTERPEAIEIGIASLAINKDVDFVVDFLKKKFKYFESPFGRPGVSKRIIDILEEYL